ncbi:formate dehydrogenase subunit gamma [Chloroflexota bacterium]
MTEPRVVERFRKHTVWFHWIHTLAFLVLLITGAILFLPGLGAPAAGGLTRFIHRAAVVFYIVAPIAYTLSSPKTALHFIKEVLIWGRDDIRWLFRAPDYYFGGDENKMIPQGHINTGQKMWQLVVVITGIMFIVSGFILWFFKGTVSADLFQWTLIIHDIAFVVAFLMVLVHIYLGAIHPRMTESLRSILDGKISKKYARSHYLKWHDTLATGDD